MNAEIDILMARIILGALDVCFSESMSGLGEVWTDKHSAAEERLKKICKEIAGEDWYECKSD